MAKRTPKIFKDGSVAPGPHSREPVRGIQEAGKRIWTGAERTEGVAPGWRDVDIALRLIAMTAEVLTGTSLKATIKLADAGVLPNDADLHTEFRVISKLIHDLNNNPRR
jgi:hypothetical protein